MNKRLKTSLILIASLLYSLNLFSGELIKIPFIINNDGLIVVQVFINDHAEPYYFTLATSSRTTVWKDQKEQFKKLKIDTEKSRITFSKLSIGGQLNIENTKLDFENKSITEQDNISGNICGKIGSSILRNYIVQIDFKEKMLSFGKEINDFNIPPNTASTIYTSSFLNNIPTFQLSNDTLQNKSVLLATESPYSIICSIEQAKSLFRKKEAQSAYDFHNGEINETISPFKLKFKTLNIYDIEVKDISVEFSDRYYPSLGVSFLKDYKITIDYLEKRFYLEPQFENKLK